MPEVIYRNRRAARIENEHLRVTVTVEGGHIAEILDKQTAVNPLWTPPWDSIEPSTYDRARHPQYGADAESKLLAGLMGHNICLDLFGSPSPDEAAAGMTVHGEASIVAYEISQPSEHVLHCRATLPVAQLAFERRIRLNGRFVLFDETVENLSILDRPIAWTQHVTLGPPFIAHGETQIHVPIHQSITYEEEPFTWPNLRDSSGATHDLRTFSSLESSGRFTAHSIDPALDRAYFIAWAPASQLAIGYAWRRQDFPFIGIWEENRSRHAPPWNGQTITQGLEFGVTAIPESRRKMINRGTIFNQPAFRWLPARSKAHASYYAFAVHAPAGIPKTPPQP